ncbi:MAG: DUF2339 domain-containing protein [Bryobacteraceae bacterium]
MPSPEEELRAVSEALARLRQEQQDLEARVHALESRITVHQEPPPLPAQQQPVVAAAPPPAQPIIAPPPSRDGEGAVLRNEAALETTVGLNWVNRIGVITLILGAAFFFKYAVDAGWIGPGARVLLGLLAAAVSLIAGDGLSRRGHAVFAQGIAGLGLSLCYLSLYAAATLYHLVEPAVGFGLMSAVTIGAVWLALRYESQAIAVLGMIGGYLTPPALSTGENHPWILFTYVFMLNMGAVTLARFRPWKTLEPLAAAATTVLYLGWYGKWFDDADRTVALFFAVAFYAQFTVAQRAVWFAAQFLAPIAAFSIWTDNARFLPWEFLFATGGLVAAQVRNWEGAPVWTLVCYWLPFGFWIVSGNHSSDPVRMFEMLSMASALFLLWLPWRATRSTDPPRATDLSVMAGSAAAYFAASYWLLNPDYHQYMGLLAAGVGGFLIVIAWQALKGDAAQLTLGVALTFVTLAVPIEFVGFRATLAWAMEGAVLAWISAKLSIDWLRGGAGVVLALTVGRLFAYDLWMNPSNTRFLAFAGTAIALWLTARFLTNAIAYTAGHAIFLFALSLEIGTWVGRNIAREDQTSVQNMAISILMTVYAVLLVTLGVATRTVINRILGLALLGLVVAKLYLLDVWVVGLGFRIAAFFVLGVLLLVVSFLYSRFKPKLQRWWKPDSPAVN